MDGRTTAFTERQGVMIRPLEMTDICTVVDIYLTCFSDSASTKLGRGFLDGYITGFCGSSRGVAFVHTVESRVVGFILGGMNISALSREIVSRSKAKFAQSVIRNLMRHPVKSTRIFWGYARAFLLPKKKTFYSDKTAGLVSIAVLPEFRLRGIAEELIRAFLTELRRRGIHACRVGVEAENTSARKLYEKMGFGQANEEGTSYIIRLDKKG